MRISRRKAMAAGMGVVGAGMFAERLQAEDKKVEIPAEAVILVAEVKAKVGEEENVKKALVAMVAPTREEPGCLCYNLHQSKVDPTKFMFYEQWASQEALDAHGKTPHMTAMRQAIDGKTEGGGATPYTYLQ